MNPQFNLSLDHIDSDNLANLCCKLAEAILSGHKLSGPQLAHLAKRLIAAESAPGGPYYSAQSDLDFATNLAVGYLFTCLKKPLPNVDAFIAANRERQKLSTQTKKLLKRYDTLRQSPHIAKPTIEETSQLIYRQVTTQFESFDEDLKHQGLSFLKRLQKADKTHEITLLPAIFYRSLASPFSFPPLAFLGEANVYTWIAYTIYDHLIDDNADIQYLPVANVALRLALARYQTIFPSNHSFHRKVAATYTAMDAANAWELTHARCTLTNNNILIPTIPSYNRREILADRSFAHALGPLAIANLAISNTTALGNIEKGMRHYLIARQLNDDLHDWQQDIQNGQLTVVVSHILKQVKIKPGTHKTTPLIRRMQSNFWNHSITTLTQSVIRHVKLSQKYLLKSGILREKSDLFALVGRLETIAQSSQKEHERYKSFAATYHELSQNKSSS